MTQFGFLQREWPAVFEAAGRAEELARSDPRAACFYARRTLELAVAWAFKHDARLKIPYQDNLSALVHEPTFKQATGEMIFTKMKIIITLGNRAVHRAGAIPADDAVAAARELFQVCYWLAHTYARAARPPASLRFDPTALPAPHPVPQQSLEALEQLQTSLAERDEKLTALLADRDALDDELERLRAEVGRARQAATAQPDTHDYSEAETRDYFIDLLLREAGLAARPEARPRVRGRRDAQRPRTRASSITCSGATTASPSAWSRPSAPSGIRGSASSRPSSTPTAWRQQFGQRPVIFYSNGYEHWIWDDAWYPPRRGAGVLHEGRAGAADPAAHQPQAAGAGGDRPEDRGAILPDAGHPARSASRSSATRSARHCW